jgi:predicted RNA-binding protein YlxR (DUF448 family)
VANKGVLEVDLRQILPGRGAYLHPSESCLDHALKRRAIGRALRATLDSDQVAAALRSSVVGQRLRVDA